MSSLLPPPLREKKFPFTSLLVIRAPAPFLFPLATPLPNCHQCLVQSWFLLNRDKKKGVLEDAGEMVVLPCYRSPVILCKCIPVLICELYLPSLQRQLITNYMLYSTYGLSFKRCVCAYNPLPILIVHNCSRL